MISKIKRDEIARELSRKYQKPYSEIRREISDILTGYAHVIKDKAESEGISRNEIELGAIYNHFRNLYGDI